MRTLSVTISDALYTNLKRSVSSQKISKFVSEAVSEKLTKKKEALYQSYLEASQDTEREKEIKDWDSLSVENWDQENQQHQIS
ncbi:MAG: hypothetical protein K2X53_00370 [Alphaproteobacteria bacterium]|nr:hypothetical protein [Alphaproteobacteria bacterium]